MHHPGAHPERETIDLECRVPHHFCPSMDDPTDIPQLTPWMHQECCALTSLWCQIRPSDLVWRLENPLPTRQRSFNPFPADAWTKTSDQRRCDATGTDARLPSSGKACGQGFLAGETWNNKRAILNFKATVEIPMLGTMIENYGDTLEDAHMPLGWPISIDGAVREFCICSLWLKFFGSRYQKPGTKDTEVSSDISVDTSEVPWLVARNVWFFGCQN